MADKVLTISIAAYNLSERIDQCLASFASSKFIDDIELIVTNDALGDVLKNASDEDVEISIAQIDKDKHELTRTEPQRYLPPED